MRLMTLWPLVAACNGDDGQSEDAEVGDDDDVVLPPGRGPTLVADVTAEVAAGGWLYATILTDDVVVPRLGGADLELAHSLFPIWRVPSQAPAGPAELLFTGVYGGEEQAVEVVVTEPWFVDVAAAAGVAAPHEVDGWQTGCAQSLTAVGLADIDLDGDLDLLHGNLTGPSRLYLSESEPGRIAFVPAPGALPELDYVTAVQFADWDNDGDPDLFLGRRGDNRLLRNDLVGGVSTFVDVSETSGLAMALQRTTSGGWGDFDGDGDLDLYEVNHAWCIPSGDVADHRNADHLYRNQGSGEFYEITAQLDDSLGQVSRRFGFAAMWLDHDRDGLQDLWVVNDFVPTGGRSVLWRTASVGEVVDMVDVTLPSNVSPLPDALGKATNAMGGAVGDLNRDGLPDFAYSNIGQNFLVYSQGPGEWADVSAQRGVERTTQPWGEPSTTWGTHLLDLDNDGDLDVVYVGGELIGGEPQPHAVFENVGESEPMVDVSWRAGLASPAKGAASAQGDLDGDGWLDLVVANWGSPLEVWHNQLGERLGHHWLVVDLEGDGVGVNRDGFGAIVELERLDGTVDTCWRNPMPSMASTGDAGCHFGLGRDPGARGIRIVWPDGEVASLPVDTIDARVRVRRAP
jgi:enediyne biosynthesis protein E4